MNKKNEIYIELVIDTENDYPYLDDIIGFKSTKVSIKGEPFYSPISKRAIPEKKNETNIWIYKSKVRNTNDGQIINKMIKEVVEVFDENPNKIRKLFKKYKKNRLTFVINFHETNPYFSLDIDTINKLSFYGLLIDFDMHCL